MCVCVCVGGRCWVAVSQAYLPTAWMGRQAAGTTTWAGGSAWSRPHLLFLHLQPYPCLLGIDRRLGTLSWAPSLSHGANSPNMDPAYLHLGMVFATEVVLHVFRL